MGGIYNREKRERKVGMKKRRFLIYALMIVLLGVFSYSLWQVLNITGEYQGGTDSYEALDQYVSMPEIREDETDATAETEATQFDVRWPEVDFDALKQVNDDVVGWIYIPGTEINYPIVQGEDNDYYLTHLFNGQRNSSGCIFLDCNAEADFSSLNNVLHGHHMRNESMFARICEYKDQSHFDAHPLGLLLTSDGNYVVQFFSGYVCNTEANAWDLAFTAEQYESWLDGLARKSAFKSDVAPTTEDRILTLSTCTYEFKNARFVLHGILTPA